METKEILQRLCEETGVSGRESEMLGVIRSLTGSFADEIRLLPTGTITARIGADNAKHRIMLDAHADRIGLIITDINEEGFLKAYPVGGMDMRALAGTVVTVQGKKNVPGVICTLPPHLIKKEEGMTKDDLWIDTGLPSDTAGELFSRGDTAFVYGKFRELLGNKVTAPALDNRAGCAVIIRAAQLLAGRLKNTSITLVFSSQEETNESGAATAAFSLMPDEAIVVDVGFAKQDGVPDGQSGELGKGPIISIAPVLSRRMTDGLVSAAERLGTGYSFEVDGGSTGTNADGIAITAGGIPCAVISVPEKNMHTQTEIISLDDIESTAAVIAEYIAGGEGK